MRYSLGWTENRYPIDPIERISMITGTYERYWKMRMSVMRGAYAYRNTLQMAVFVVYKKFKKRAGNRISSLVY
jgi:hypothetical protein